MPKTTENTCLHSKIQGIDAIVQAEEHNEIVLSVDDQGVAPVALDGGNNRANQITCTVNPKDTNFIDPKSPYFFHNPLNRGMTDDVWIQNIVLARTSLLKEIIESLGIDLRDTDPILYQEYDGEQEDKQLEEEWMNEKNFQVPTFKINNYPREAESFNRVIYRTHYDEITTTTQMPGAEGVTTTSAAVTGGANTAATGGATAAVGGASGASSGGTTVVNNDTSSSSTTETTTKSPKAEVESWLKKNGCPKTTNHDAVVTYQNKIYAAFNANPSHWKRKGIKTAESAKAYVWSIFTSWGGKSTKQTTATTKSSKTSKTSKTNNNDSTSTSTQVVTTSDGNTSGESSDGTATTEGDASDPKNCTTTLPNSSYVPPSIANAAAQEALIQPLGAGGGTVKEEHWSNEHIVEGYINHMSSALDGVFKLTDKMFNDIMRCPHEKGANRNIHKIAQYEGDEAGLRKILNNATITFEGMWLSKPEFTNISPAVFLIWTAAMFGESGLNGPAYDAADPLNAPFDDGIMIAEALGKNGGANSAGAAGIDNCGEALYGLTHWKSKIHLLQKSDPDIWGQYGEGDGSVYIADSYGALHANPPHPYPKDGDMGSTWITRQSLGWHCWTAAIKVIDKDNSKDGSYIFKSYTHDQMMQLSDEEYERMVGAVWLSKSGNYAFANKTIANAGQNAYDDAQASSIFSSQSNTRHFQGKTTGWHNGFASGMALAWMLGKYIFENNKQEIPPFPWNA